MRGGIVSNLCDYLRANLPYRVVDSMLDVDDPDAVVLLSSSGGRSEGYPVGYQEETIQVRVRATHEYDANVTSFAVWDFLRRIEHGLTLPAIDQTGAEDKLVKRLVPIQRPFYVGLKNGLHWYSFNLLLQFFEAGQGPGPGQGD
jgi:hypothetical protein